MYNTVSKRRFRFFYITTWRHWLVFLLNSERTDCGAAKSKLPGAQGWAGELSNCRPDARRRTHGCGWRQCNCLGIVQHGGTIENAEWLAENVLVLFFSWILEYLLFVTGCLFDFVSFLWKESEYFFLCLT